MFVFNKEIRVSAVQLGLGLGLERGGTHTSNPEATSRAILTNMAWGTFVLRLINTSYNEPLGQNSVTRLKCKMCPLVPGLVTAPTKLITLGWLPKRLIICASSLISMRVCSSMCSSKAS